MHPVPSDLKSAALKFADWLDKTGYASYDPYDLWGTKYGLWARKIYYAKGRVGIPLVAPILLADILCPSVRKLLVAKQRFATADAQLILAFLNLWSATGAEAWLEKAIQLSNELLAYSIPGFSGHCWGYPFDWQNTSGLWKGNTPFITCTPYCFEAFLGLYDATGNKAYLDVAASTARFVSSDLRDTETGPDAAAGSYGPFDDSQVINASAYRSFVLVEAADRFGMEAYREQALKNLNFVLRNQRADGSWLYALNSPGEAFIDHFHTCFVLKNLFKIKKHFTPTLSPERSGRTEDAIRRGWKYYRGALFDEDETPKSFAIEPRRQIVQLEMYNLAEAITLGTLLRHEIPEALAFAQRLAADLVREHQLADGHFVTRVFRGGIRHTFPFLRWPQAQLFYALTNLLASQQRETKLPRHAELNTV